MNLPSGIWIQRLLFGAWLVVCLAFAGIAWTYHAQLSYEPVGPRAFPLLCLGLMAVALAWLVLRPTPIEHDEDDPPLDARLLRKVAACIALLLVYAGLFEPLGFVLSTVLIGVPMAMVYGGRPLPSLLTISLLGIGLYLLFDRVLEVPLPQGLLDGLSS